MDVCQVWVSKALHIKSGFCLRFSCVLSHFPCVNPTHRHDSLFGNACSLAYRNHIIAYPLLHFFVLSCSKLCTLISLFFLMFISTRARPWMQASRFQDFRTCQQSQGSSLQHQPASSKLLALNVKAASLERTGGTLDVDCLARTFLSNC